MIGGARSHSRSSHSDGSKGDVDDVLMLHDSVDGIGGGNGDGGGAFGSYGGGEGRGGLPSMPEGDDEDDDSQRHHHHLHLHQQHHQQEGMEVDLGMNMGMMGMDTMSEDSGAMNFNGMDNNKATAENLRGRPRVVRRPSNDAISADKITNAGVRGVLKEEIGDDDVLGVVGGFGIGIGTARGM